MKIQDKKKMAKENFESGEKKQESIPKTMFKKNLNQESIMKKVKIHSKNAVKLFHSTKQELLMKTKNQDSMNQESIMSTKVNYLKQRFGKINHRAIMPLVFIFLMFLVLFNCPETVAPTPPPSTNTMDTNTMDTNTMDTSMMDVLEASNALQIIYSPGETSSNVTKNITLATNDTDKNVFISWESEKPSVISISNSTGLVYRKQANDSVTLTASLTKGDYTNIKNFLLTVVGDSTSPVFSALSTFSVNENASNGTVVGTVVATDIGGTGVIGYVITNGNDGDVFDIDINGVLTVAGNIDFESIPSYSLSVQVMDKAGNRATGIFTVNVIDVVEDTAPVIEDQQFSINDGVDIGSPVGTVQATDDVGVTGFQITDGNTGNAFAISNDGALTTSNDIDLMTTSSYSLTVRVSDAAGNSATGTVTVIVNDQTAPMISAQTFSVRENLSNDYEVGTVQATDNVGVTGFQIIGGDNNEHFDINSSGVLTTTRMLNFTNYARYQLTVQVTDDAELTNTAIITVNVTDNTPPAISNQTFSVDENVINGTVVAAAVSASDNDGVTSFEITGGSPAFAINNSGQLTTSGPIDHETTSSYSFTVQVSDNAGNMNTAMITVNVGNQPDVLSRTYNLHANNSSASGIVYYTNFFYVVNQDNDRFYYYSSGTTAGESDFTLIASIQLNPASISANGVTINNDDTNFYLVDPVNETIPRFYSPSPGMVSVRTVFSLNDSNDSATGITYYNNNLYVVDLNDMVYRYSLAGDFQNSFNLNTANSNATGITYYSNSLYVVDSDDSVYRYSLTGSYIGRFDLSSANSDPHGITYFDDSFYVVDRAGGKVYRYKR